MAAYAFARLRWPGRDKVFVLFLAALMVPPIFTMLPNFLLIKQLGLLNTYAGIVLPFLFMTPFAVFFLRQFFLGITREIEEAAMIDGAGHFRIFFRIILPMSAAPIATLAILTYIGAWNEYLWPLLVGQRRARRVADRGARGLPVPDTAGRPGLARPDGGHPGGGPADHRPVPASSGAGRQLHPVLRHQVTRFASSNPTPSIRPPQEVQQKAPSLMKRKLGILGLAMALPLVLTACVGGSDTTDTSAAAAPRGSGTGEVSYWLWDANQQPAYQACADAFAAANPGTTVKITQLGWDDYWTKLTAGFIAGTAPDVFTDHLSKYPEFVKNNQLLAAGRHRQARTRSPPISTSRVWPTSGSGRTASVTECPRTGTPSRCSTTRR